jgi:hypothetical protein
MRHLLRKQSLREMIGDDAAESVQNLVAIFVGQRPPQLLGLEGLGPSARARGGTRTIRR